jgi:hypothetical protein
MIWLVLPAFDHACTDTGRIPNNKIINIINIVSIIYYNNDKMCFQFSIYDYCVLGVYI